jgi:hypothetical protein
LQTRYVQKERKSYIEIVGFRKDHFMEIEVALAYGILPTNLHQCLLCSVFTIEAFHKMALKSMD